MSERVHFLKYDAYVNERTQPVYHCARRPPHWNAKAKRWVAIMRCGYVLSTRTPVTGATMLRGYADGFARPCGRCFR